MSVKKYVFKMVSELGNSERTDKVSINSIWKKYFSLSSEQQRNGETGEAFLNSKEDLKKALEHMEADDLIMQNGDDVILT
jgi:hypothetical protein